MFFSLALLSASLKIDEFALSVLDDDDGVVSQVMIREKSEETISLTENQTLTCKAKSSLDHAPVHAFYVLENGPYSLTGEMVFKNELSFRIKPKQLEQLYKHSALYSLKVSILVKDEDPIMKEIAKVQFTANGEVRDNFTDVEWDFQEPHKQPAAIVVKSLTFAMFVPLLVLLVLLCINGCNCGYFPHNFFDAIFSLTFVGALGAFFYYFIVFWRSINFEEMLKQLCIIIPALGLLLRLALSGRAKMVDRREAEKEKAEKAKTD